MSFFDNTKIVGGAFVVVGVLQIIAAIFAIVAGFMDQPEETKELITQNWTAYSIVIGVGSLICALLYYVFAALVYRGRISKKIFILATYVRVVGIVTAIGGVFGAIAAIIGGMDIGASIFTAIILIVIGLIIVFIASKIVDGEQTIGDKIIWILLLIVFVLKLVFEAIGVVGSFNPLSLTGILSGIAGVVIALFMLAFLFDSEVKSEMNM